MNKPSFGYRAGYVATDVTISTGKAVASATSTAARSVASFARAVKFGVQRARAEHNTSRLLTSK